MYDILQRTFDWFKKAVPTPLSKNIHTQMGCHFEEVVEMIDEVDALDTQTDVILSNARNALHDLANHLKANDGVICVRFTQRGKFLDAICDQLVTAVGTAHMLSMDPVNGLAEVNDSNWSKFDDNGEPIFNENRKVMKGPNYREADLTAFV